MKRMTFIAGNVALFPKAHGKSSDQCELTPEQTQQICTVSPLLEMSATSEPVFASAKRWPAIDKLVAKINRTYVITGRSRTIPPTEPTHFLSDLPAKW